ncbi:MAG: GNAT family N-acetyltransferase [Bacteroidetes bacterium]|nr:GNAT family N-acetyltransferase [Bacteroidota bacterium]
MNANNEINLKLRFAVPQDISMILYFIKQLAIYENMIDEVTATEETLYESIFVNKIAEVIFAENDTTPIGFALFFHNFSTFLGKPGIYIEDLFVLEQYRGFGIGKALLKHLAKIAIDRNCGRLEWWCLDWNQSSIDFYTKIGAKPMSDWTVFRISGNTLNDLANEKS